MKKETVILIVIFLIACVLIGGLWYYNKYSFQRKEEKIIESIKKSVDEISRLECLNDAYETYGRNWDESCKRLGKGKGCLLPASLAGVLDERLEDSKEDCYREYP